MLRVLWLCFTAWLRPKPKTSIFVNLLSFSINLVIFGIIYLHFRGCHCFLLYPTMNLMFNDINEKEFINNVVLKTWYIFKVLVLRQKYSGKYYYLSCFHMKLSSILSNYLGELDDFCEIYIFCRVKKFS